MNMFKLLMQGLKKRYTQRSSGLVTFFNPYSYYLARKDVHLFSKIDDFYIDGQLLVRLLAILGVPSIQRLSFDNTSLAPIVFTDCCNHEKSIYLIGAKEKEIATSVSMIKDSFPELKISGFRNGYFSSDEERDAVLKSIFELSPDVVVCGMGTPYQEKFIIDLNAMGWSGVGYTCGGFFHQSTKGLNYYPKWMDRFNLRWVYRIYDEPKLVNRYFIQYPIAISALVFDYIKLKFSN